MYLSEPYLQVRHSSILCYNLPLQSYRKSNKFQSFNTYSHKVTNHAAKRIKKAIDILLQVSPSHRIFNPITNRHHDHRLSFITVTISSKEKHIDSSTGYKLLLKPFLQKMNRKHGMKTYIWKAEYQRNGQLHYHILTPSWIHYEKIRNDWNATLEQHGFLSNWRKEYKNRIPNSTDVHAIYRIKNIEAYLMKYLSKKQTPEQSKDPKHSYYVDETGEFKVTVDDRKGKIWDCSMNLKKAKYFSVPLPNILEDLYTVPERISCDQCIIIKLPDPRSILPRGIDKQYIQWITAFSES